MKRIPKKIVKLINIVSAIPSKQDVAWAASNGRRYDQNQVIATALAGALIDISKGTAYEDLCTDIINKCVDIDFNESIDKRLLGFEDSSD